MKYYMLKYDIEEKLAHTGIGVHFMTDQWKAPTPWSMGRGPKVVSILSSTLFVICVGVHPPPLRNFNVQKSIAFESCQPKCAQAIEVVFGHSPCITIYAHAWHPMCLFETSHVCKTGASLGCNARSILKRIDPTIAIQTETGIVPRCIPTTAHEWKHQTKVMLVGFRQQVKYGGAWFGLCGEECLNGSHIACSGTSSIDTPCFAAPVHTLPNMHNPTLPWYVPHNHTMSSSYLHVLQPNTPI